MRKRILSFLLVLALLSSTATAFASSIGNIEKRATSGQVITLETTDFTDELDLDPADEDETLTSVTFPTLPAANSAVIRLDDNAITAGDTVAVAEITAGDLTVEITATQGNKNAVARLCRTETAQLHTYCFAYL